MPVSNPSKPCISVRLIARPLTALVAACLVHGVAHAATLPVPPKTFDTAYAAPPGATLTVAAGGDLRAALAKAQLGDTIVLEAGATWTGPIKLPNKTGGSGWIYVVSSRLSSLPAPGTRVSPANAANMPKIVAPNTLSAVVTEANSHHFRFVGIEFATVPGSKQIYQVVTIGNKDTSPATLPSHIVFDRCYVHGEPNANTRRGIEMDGAYVAVVDSYITNFQEDGIDSQGLLAFNTTGPIQIRNNYIEAATENVLFGGADSRTPELLPADIEISNNHFFKPLSLIPSKKYPMKNLLELKAAQRVAVTGNTFENNPAHAQTGFAILITPRNQNGTAPWSVTTDITFTGNVLINVGSGINVLGQDGYHPTPPPPTLTERVLIRDNLIGVTGLNGADGRAFQFYAGGGDYTVDHNTVINTASPPGSPASDLVMAQSPTKITNFVFTNNLSSPTHYGVIGAGTGPGTRALDNNFTNWTFSKNVLVDAAASEYPAGNFFPTGVGAVGFTNYAGGNYALAAHSPYKNAGTDGLDIGATSTPRTSVNLVLPNPPSNVVVK
jgi:Right handed beta helix region